MAFDWSTAEEVEAEVPASFDWASAQQVNPSPQAMFEEALAREEQETDYTEEEVSFLQDQEGMDDRQPIVAHLKEREGVRLVSYKDSLEKLTGGVGHLLTKEEQDLYPEGTQIPQEVVDRWLVEDSEKALSAARAQAKEIGEEDEGLVLALSAVNFQLGTNWKKEHEKTWRLMKEGMYEEAAEEAANSTWNKQTPKRVQDFQQALRKTAKEREFSDFEDGVYEDPETKERFKVKGGRRL